ncbi:Ctr copper transporter family-domain-containing protein [Kockovaella imperatae]|uniref:Copper transport protein n=1 Tax=Kockovaella imperatae TaxID=4999 RepID=A0A1Y1UNU0_9TREE|nr:Ctr copper transporter family-domain-containing protein [Kockovaella imperatae]ORX39174.1 Ctr copper transporter family-domain-containing protein [Kockovaella imperatae]
MAPHEGHSVDMDMSGGDMSGMDNTPLNSYSRVCLVPGSSMGNMMMKMYFHGSIGDDYFLFKSWVPTSPGAIVGICIAVFILAIFDRYLAAMRRACDMYWRRGRVGFTVPRSGGTHAYAHPSLQNASNEGNRATGHSSTNGEGCSSTNVDTDQIDSLAADYSGLDEKLDPSTAHLPRAARLVEDPMRTARWSRPFQWGVDIPRGLLQSLQTLIHYVLMLTVMTFQLWFIIAIIVGSGVGEVLFGRFGSGLPGCP